MNLGLLKPSVVYFALAFAAGFVLGPLRMFVLAPRVGPVAAVLIEAPIILTASFGIARWVLRRFATDASAYQRLAIGVIAFALLMAAELLLSASLGNSPREFAASLLTPAGFIGLAGQVLFALIPLSIRTR